MFANTQMLGLGAGFPDTATAPASKPAQAPAAGVAPSSTNWLDACLAPGGEHAVTPMSPMGGVLSMLPSFLPSVHPSVSGGGIVPSAAAPSASMPNLPGRYNPTSI